jgi:hypothetical protein
MHAYIALCLATGIGTEEARALRGEQVTLAPRHEHRGVLVASRYHTRAGGLWSDEGQMPRCDM